MKKFIRTPGPCNNCTKAYYGHYCSIRQKSMPLTFRSLRASKAWQEKECPLSYRKRGEKYPDKWKEQTNENS